MRSGRALVITDPTLLVRHANDRLVMLRDGKTVAAMPLADISHIALHGPITMTGAAVARALDAGLEISLHTSGGKFRGMIHSADPKNVYLLLAQADGWNKPERRVAFARPMVAGKVAGQRLLLQQHALSRGSSEAADAVARLERMETQAEEEGDLEALRGYEGAAAAAYFGVFGCMLGEGWDFPGRVRRPPTDPVNALLSFGYTLAVSEMSRHLALGGFDNRIGLMHGLRYGRESLPLDLVEEFRAPMVDRFTLRVLNRGQLSAASFVTGDGGAVRLTDEGRRTYLELWEEMLASSTARLRNEGPVDEDGGGEVRIGAAVTDEDGTPTWRFKMERQVNRLRRFLLEGAPYHPLQRSRKGGPEASQRRKRDIVRVDGATQVREIAGEEDDR